MGANGSLVAGGAVLPRFEETGHFTAKPFISLNGIAQSGICRHLVACLGLVRPLRPSYGPQQPRKEPGEGQHEKSKEKVYGGELPGCFEVPS